jgi:hypothetical protein
LRKPLELALASGVHLGQPTTGIVVPRVLECEPLRRGVPHRAVQRSECFGPVAIRDARGVAVALVFVLGALGDDVDERPVPGA